MAIFVAAFIVAAAFRTLHPSRVRETAVVRFIGMPVLAAALQFALFIPAVRGLGSDSRFVFVIASYVIVGSWLILNTLRQAPWLRRCGTLISLGWLANVTAIIANHGMPVSQSALLRIGVRHPTVSNGNLFKHVLATSHSIVPWLGDFIPVAVPVLRNVISIGDVLVIIGAMLAIQRVDLHSGVFVRAAPRQPTKDMVLQVPQSS